MAPNRTPASPQSTALTPLTNDLPAWAQEVEKYRRPDVNLILPAVPLSSELAFGHKVKVSLVQIDTNPDHGEIYKVGWRNGADVYALGKPALEKIAHAAGIQFQTRRIDDRSNSDFCEFECQGGMRNESGMPIVQGRTKAFNMPDVRAESLEQRTKSNERAQAKKTPAQIADDVDREMAQFKKHIVARTETGAILRLIRGLLGIRQQWTAAELAKPFVLMRVDFQPDASDPDVKRFLLEQGANAGRALYHQPPPMARPTEAQFVDEPDEVEEQGADAEGGEVTQPDREPGSSSPPPQGEPDYTKLALEGMGVLGLPLDEQAELMKKHGTDYKALYLEVNERANKRSAA